MENMKAHVQYSPWINLYVATLLGGEFDNCHGQGKTPEDAIISLKILVNLGKYLYSQKMAGQKCSSYRSQYGCRV
jgi:hypothetical protein